jgi:hypothetical protein
MIDGALGSAMLNAGPPVGAAVVKQAATSEATSLNADSKSSPAFATALVVEFIRPSIVDAYDVVGPHTSSGTNTTSVSAASKPCERAC